MTPVDDPVSLGEVSRQLNSFITVTNENFKELNKRMTEELVGSKYYEVAHKMLEDKVTTNTRDIAAFRAEYEKEMEAERGRRRSDWMLVVQSFVGPAFVALLVLLLTTGVIPVTTAH